MPDFIDPDDLNTPADQAVHGFIGRMVRNSNKRNTLVFALCIILVINASFDTYWNVVRMGDWREEGRMIQLRLLDALDKMEERERRRHPEEPELTPRHRDEFPLLLHRAPRRNPHIP